MRPRIFYVARRLLQSQKAYNGFGRNENSLQYHSIEMLFVRMKDMVMGKHRIYYLGDNCLYESLTHRSGRNNTIMTLGLCHQGQCLRRQPSVAQPGPDGNVIVRPNGQERGRCCEDKKWRYY